MPIAQSGHVHLPGLVLDLRSSFSLPVQPRDWPKASTFGMRDALRSLAKEAHSLRGVAHLSCRREPEEAQADPNYDHHRSRNNDCRGGSVFVGAASARPAPSAPPRVASADVLAPHLRLPRRYGVGSVDRAAAMAPWGSDCCHQCDPGWRSPRVCSDDHPAGSDPLRCGRQRHRSDERGDRMEIAAVKTCWVIRATRAELRP